MKLHLLGLDRMIRQRVIREQEGERILFAYSPSINSLMQAINEKLLSAKRVKQLESAIGRLRNAVQIHQAKSAVKRS